MIFICGSHWEWELYRSTPPKTAKLFTPHCTINCPHYSSAAVPFCATWSRSTTSLSTGTQKTSRPGPVWMRPLHGSQETSDVVHSSIVWVHHRGFFHVLCGLSLFLEFGAGTRFSLKNLVPPVYLNSNPKTLGALPLHSRKYSFNLTVEFWHAADTVYRKILLWAHDLILEAITLSSSQETRSYFPMLKRIVWYEILMFCSTKMTLNFLAAFQGLIGKDTWE